MRKEENKKIPKGLLQNMITYFCFKANPNSTTKLMKLCYLAEVYYYQMHGKRLTDLPFEHYKYGPFAKKILRETETLYDEGIIKEVSVKTKSGKSAIIPKPSVSRTKVSFSDKNIFLILQDVVSDWGEVKTKDIVEYCKNTLPFFGTPFEEEIDFSRVDEIEEMAKKKKMSKEKVATLDVISNKELLKDTLKGIEDAKEGKLLDHKSVFG